MDIIRKRAYARAGLLGNPSDGYNGKTISIIVRNFWAEVVLYEWDSVDIVDRKLHLHLSDLEIRNRLAKWKRPAPKFKTGYLALYSRLAESADKGAIIRHKLD